MRLLSRSMTAAAVMPYWSLASRLHVVVSPPRFRFQTSCPVCSSRATKFPRSSPTNTRSLEPDGVDTAAASTGGLLSAPASLYVHFWDKEPTVVGVSVVSFGFSPVLDSEPP